MKPPPPEILAVMNHVVNCRDARNTAVMDYLMWVQGILSLPDEHTAQMVAALAYDQRNKGEDAEKTMALYKAVTESAQEFREAILAKLREAGMPAVDIPAWIV